MKNINILLSSVVFLLLFSVPKVVYSQVSPISSQSFESQRIVHSGTIYASPLSAPGSVSVGGASTGAASISVLPQTSYQSNISEPFVTNEVTYGNTGLVPQIRREFGDSNSGENGGDPGNKSEESPIGSGWIMLLFAMVLAVYKSIKK